MIFSTLHLSSEFCPQMWTQVKGDFICKAQNFTKWVHRLRLCLFHPLSHVFLSYYVFRYKLLCRPQIDQSPAHRCLKGTFVNQSSSSLPPLHPPAPFTLAALWARALHGWLTGFPFWCMCFNPSVCRCVYAFLWYAHTHTNKCIYQNRRGESSERLTLAKKEQTGLASWTLEMFPS